MRCYESLPYGWYLECTTAGTTGSSDITIPSPLDVGDTVTDGTVVWTIRKIGSGDGFAVGDIIMIAGNNTIRDGWLECDGRAVSRTMFADLFDAIGTTYGAGDGSTTFNLPNYSDGKFPEGSTVAGVVKQPGLPNITGSFSSDRAWAETSNQNDGALTYTKISSNLNALTNSSPQGGCRLDFDASRSNPIYGASNTVQPYSLTTRYIIKAYDGVTPTPAEADISEMLTELTSKANINGSNMTYHKDVITTSGTYTAPVTGLYKITVKGGGGGGGRYYDTVGGGGGGEGGTTIDYVMVSANDAVSVVIGAGGAGNGSGAGANGGDSIVTIGTNTITGGGGGGALANTTGGIGGNGTIVGASGSAGDAGYPSSPGSGGTGGGNGGAAGGRLSVLRDGQTGGGGAGGNSSYAPSAGGDGYVWFEYYTP
jgi:microcystin-dependent protein